MKTRDNSDLMSFKPFFAKLLKVPKTWEIKSMSAIISNFHSGTWGGDPKSQEHSFPVIRSTEITHNNKINLESVQYRDIPEKQLKRNLLEYGDILLVASSGSSRLIGRPALFDLDVPSKHVFSNFLLRLRAKGIHFKFLYYYLNSTIYRSFLTNYQETSTGLRNFPKTDFEEILIAVPSLDEQQKIISVLSNVDVLIDSFRSNLDLLTDLKTSLLRKLLTRGIGHKKFKKIKWLFGKEMEIPFDWEQKTVGEIFTLFTGSTPLRSNPDFFTGNIPWVTSGDLNKNIVTTTIEKITDEAQKKTKLKIFPKGTFLIATYGLEASSTRGKCGILGFDGTMNQACIAFSSSKLMTTEYLYYYYIAFGESIAFNFAQGTKQQNLYPNTVKEIPLILPPLKEQQKTVSIFSNIDSNILFQKSKLSGLEYLKNGLLEKLLVGEIRVN